MTKLSGGAAGELMAARFLREQGYTILAANYRCRFGEIDLIAQEGDILAFVEVKTRAADAYYAPREAVTRQKQQRIFKTALAFLEQHPMEIQPRFDVIDIVTVPKQPMRVLELDHIKDAYRPEEWG